MTCKVDQFLCAENYCIPSLFRCDDQRDCRDGSDEIGCPSKCDVDDDVLTFMSISVTLLMSVLF